MRPEFRELWQYRELLYILVQRDLKVRYKNSVLGFGWSLINPLVQVLTITVVLKFITGGAANSYHAYVFCATLPWLFLSTGMLDGSASLLMYQQLIRRTYFPRELIPLASVVSNLVHFLLAAAVFLVYMAVNALFWGAWHGRLSWPIQATVFLTPIPIIGMILLLAGVTMFLSVWTMFFEDIRFILDSGLRIVYWLVPVLYSPDVILHKKGYLLYTLYMLNPVSAFVTAFRKLTLPPTVMVGDPLPTAPMDALDWTFLGIALLTAALVALLGHRYFLSRQWRLAERE